MEILGLALQDFIFSIFLPFIFFYILLYALLRKSKILGEGANMLNTLLALTISALSIFSLYSLGLSSWLPTLGAVTAVSAFIIMFLFGISGYSVKKTKDYISGQAFKTEDEKKFDAGINSCETIWKKIQEEKNAEAQASLLRQLGSEIGKLESIAPKLGKSLYDYEWYTRFKEAQRAGERGG